VQSPTRGVPLTAHLNIEQRALARRLRAKKMSLRDIAKQIGCSSAGIDVMLRGQSREARPIEWVPRRGALSIEEREEILRGLSREDSLSAIARHLSRHTSSVSREVKANGGRDHYRIWPAHQRAQQCAKRPKIRKLSYAPLAKRVTEDLEKLWSPEEIALRLALEFPQETRMQLSHETIYQSLYVQGRGELRRELARCLRYGHTSRQSRAAGRGRGPRRARSLGRRFDHWRSRRECGGHPRGAHDPLSFALAFAKWSQRTRGRTGNAKGHQDLAEFVDQNHNVGPGKRTRSTPRVHRRDRRAGLLLRPPLALATRKQREHERSAAPIHAQEHRPLEVHASRPTTNSRQLE
jgi:IS30 family transposase